MTFALISGGAAFPPEASAQRILQRLRQRITPPPAPANPQPSSRTNTPASNAASPSGGVRPNRLSPINSATNPGNTVAAAENWKQVLDPAPGRDQFGFSVLEMPDAAPPADESSADTDPDPADQSATFGIDAFERDDTVTGIQVADFHIGSLADEAGVRVGDVIVAMNGLPTPTIRGLVQRIENYPVGHKVDLQIRRGGRMTEIKVPLVPRLAPEPTIEVLKPVVEKPTTRRADANRGPTDEDQTRLPIPSEHRMMRPVTTPVTTPVKPQNIELRPAPSTTPAVSITSSVNLGARFRDVHNGRGVVVETVDRGSHAEQAGLKHGDRIVAVDGRLVKDLAAWSLLLSRLDEGQQPQLKIVRGSLFLQRQLGGDDNEAVAANGDQNPANPADGGLLGGVGSFFGNLMKPAKPTAASKKPTAASKKPTAASKKPTAPKKPTAAKPSAASKPPADAGELKPPTLLPKPADQSNRNTSSTINRPVFLPGPDDMKLIDQTAYFDLPSPRRMVKKQAVAPIPPSLRTVQPPKPTPTDAEENAQLKAQIKRLQDELKKLKG